MLKKAEEKGKRFDNIAYAVLQSGEHEYVEERVVWVGTRPEADMSLEEHALFLMRGRSPHLVCKIIRGYAHPYPRDRKVNRYRGQYCGSVYHIQMSHVLPLNHGRRQGEASSCQ